MWGSVKNRSPTDPRHPPTASQALIKEGRFFSPSLHTITINQEKRMSGFDSFTLPDELGKSVEKFNKIFFPYKPLNKQKYKEKITAVGKDLYDPYTSYICIETL